MKLFHKMFMIAFLGSAAAALPAGAWADEPPPAVRAFLDNIERQAAKPGYDSLVVDGSGKVTITNLTLAQQGSGAEPGFTMKTARVEFSGIAEEAPSLYRVGRADFIDSSMTIGGAGMSFNLAMPQASAEDWYIRALGDAPTPQEELLASGTFARKMNSGRMTVTVAGQTLSIDGLDSSWAGDARTGSGLFTMKVNNIAIPEGVLAAVDQAGLLKQLGYSSLNLDLATEGDMKVEGEDLSYSFDLGLSARDMATVKLGGSASKVPLTVYSELMKAQKDGKEPDFTALMPQIQNITVNGASFRFEDGSIVKKALPLAAAMQGMDEKTLVASIPAGLQIMLMQLQNEAFAKQAVEAVTAFLNDPKSLTLKLSPASPVPVAEIMAMDPNKPGEAITRLGVSVTAND
ncbi:hypothetical protein [Aestuariivirga sp.]|uniref:hypothetical protein n=1 Tax=Aestuariivirga sp. TaxID=2650926 RepID=UPI0039195C5A